MLSILQNVPFLTALLSAFMVFLFIFNSIVTINNYFALTVNVFQTLQIYRLFTYQYFHLNIIHILFNLVSFIPLFGQLENQHGSTKSFVIFNLWSIMIGLLYVFISPLIGNIAPVIGASGIIFALFGYFSYLEHKISPTVEFTIPPSFGLGNRTFKVYNLAKPFIFLALTTLLVSSLGSFLGHFLSIVVGIGYGHLGDYIQTPVDRAAGWADNHISDDLVAKMGSFGKNAGFEAKFVRLGDTGNTLPLHSTDERFQGAGHTLR